MVCVKSPLLSIAIEIYCTQICETFAGKTVITSDHALKLEWIPDWIAIIGSGYIGLEFSDVYTALGSEVELLYLYAMPMHIHVFWNIA